MAMKAETALVLAKKEIDKKISESEIKPIGLDSTLTDENKAAPAKITGDKIDELKSDIVKLNDKKITKFYTNNLGETTLNDSDNGKIQDMILYGKSSQDGTPTPENPVEIKSVVNPTVKVCGKNLLKLNNNIINYTRADVKKISSNELIVTGTIKSEELRILGVYGSRNIVLPLKAGTYYLKTVGDLKCDSYEIGYMDGSEYKYLTIQNNGKIKLNNNGGLTTIKCNVTLGMTYTNASICFMVSNNISSYEPYHEQTVTLPYTLNAIPVSSGGNVTIGGQQYVSDYADVERGKLVKMVDSSKLDNTQSIVDKTEWLLAEPQEIDLTTEEITAFKALATYYPTTNISVNSEQLDGYTTFNYPLNMKNGWDYIKEQLGDTRDYIYDMDLQSAEAYVNSEYAVALTELEV